MLISHPSSGCWESSVSRRPWRQEPTAQPVCAALWCRWAAHNGSKPERATHECSAWLYGPSFIINISNGSTVLLKWICILHDWCLLLFVFIKFLCCTFQSWCKIWIMKQIVVTLNYDWTRSSQMPVRTCDFKFYINVQSLWHHKQLTVTAYIPV